MWLERAETAPRGANRINITLVKECAYLKFNVTPLTVNVIETRAALPEAFTV
jgi:hypothetical protein